MKPRKPKLPFGIESPAKVSPTFAASVSVDDHLGRSYVMAETWWNGEGVTISVQDIASNDKCSTPERRIQLSHCEWRAVRMAVKAVIDAENESLRNRKSQTNPHDVTVQKGEW